MKRDQKQPRLAPQQQFCSFPGCSAPAPWGFGCFGDGTGMHGCDAHKDQVEAIEAADREARRRRIEARNAEAMTPAQGNLLDGEDVK